jgi:hypothetical protein
MKRLKKRFFASHAKSSAMLVSLVLHAILIVLAASFVAVKVYQNESTQFKVPKILRPKAPLKKPQVPVKIKKRRPKPKMRQRITVKSRSNQKMPDIKMPEIVGVRTGIGAMGGDGLGASSVGFTMPEINVFGIKSRGEKIFFILDSSGRMMEDEIGGMSAYRIIKEELIRILRTLPPTTLFNVPI